MCFSRRDMREEKAAEGRRESVWDLLSREDEPGGEPRPVAEPSPVAEPRPVAEPPPVAEHGEREAEEEKVPAGVGG
jgi:hypothetical protein